MGGILFNCRVGAVILEDGYALLNLAAGDDFWFLPAGRAEIGESSPDALRGS